MDNSIKEETCTFFIQDENFIKCNSCGAIIFCSEDMQVPKRCPYCYSICTGTTHKGDYHLKDKLYARSLCDFINRNGLWNYQVKVQYRDDGGDYTGKDNMIYCLVDDNNKTITL